ncbi:MAG: bifunctional proline dehydrogenase/L-glutamate gamma-semialdehyde dehydrogenase PutA [Pseudomonadota bacterium]
MNAIDSPLDVLRAAIRAHTLADEAERAKDLLETAALSTAARAVIEHRAIGLIEAVRGETAPGLMEVFLSEYGLSTREGIALMCLAEALLRVPDADTIDALIEDKIAPSDWGRHLGKSSSSLVNASTWALMLTGKVLADEDDGLVGALRGAVRRLGEPAIRTAVGQAMREMGRQFVLGRTIEEARTRAAGMEAKGYTYSYDMLGEAARTEGDARKYHLSYSDAITALASACTSDDIRANPGISVKLSALHPRYEFGQRTRVMDELVERTLSLALLAKSAGMGFNIDAEEADRLDLSLDVIEAVLGHKALAGWDGFGVVVQAYGPRAPFVLDWLYALAENLNRRVMVRLVKGAYWDTEIKRAQVLGLSGFPVFTRKPTTDLSYMACARKLLAMTGRIYPQFATHNAHTVAAILEMGADQKDRFEFQRLHGMGETLHSHVMHDGAEESGTRCRIYAPVGAHSDLLAYLVRRLLENGANSSFVNQIVDEDVPAAEIATDPLGVIESLGPNVANPAIRLPSALFGAERPNAKGWDITDPADVDALLAARDRFRGATWKAIPLVHTARAAGAEVPVTNPAVPTDHVGTVRNASAEQIDAALAAARAAAPGWGALPVVQRADLLRTVADLYEANAEGLFALLAREAGKTLLDAVGEVREAVDFLRYYASEAEQQGMSAGRGVFACISPWNFPLAIFTGQIAAALAAGNTVVAKPAEQTPLIATRAIQLFHEAGVPMDVIQLLPGLGKAVGAALASSSQIDGLCFTGSTATAQTINRAMAENAPPDAPLIAETGGLNAMIVDSTALPEQAVRDILASAFQSAGQRCSALRVLYLQSDVAEKVLAMLKGAMAELRLGDPWDLATDVGPVIDAMAKAKIDDHIAKARGEGRVLLQLAVPETGLFVGPALLQVNGIGDLAEEIFGPVLHVATFEASELDAVVDAVNASGYGLTFGLHTRIDDRVESIVRRVRAGNIYVNRNQIGAVVGSQPFGGEGLSGTGPKAGGPHYLARFAGVDAEPAAAMPSDGPLPTIITREMMDMALVAARAHVGDRLSVADLPGPTGESNRLSLYPRGVVLALGPGAEAITRQAAIARDAGCAVVLAGAGASQVERALARDGIAALDGQLAPAVLTECAALDAVMLDASDEAARPWRMALAARSGAIVPLLAGDPGPMLHLERHVCIDTTAAGGNAALLAGSG